MKDGTEAQAGDPESAMPRPTIEYRLSDDDWYAFVRLLDREPRSDPDLAAFLARPSIFDAEEEPPRRSDKSEVSGG
jgi:hypothetical protein